MIRRRIGPGPALVTRPRLLAAAAALGVAALLPAVLPASPEPGPPGIAPLAERLGPRTWALAIPAAWIAAPLPGLREGDVIDVVGTRASERATASEVALGLRVMAVDERHVVVELTAEDAAAITEARARGLSLVPILRSVR